MKFEDDRIGMDLVYETIWEPVKCYINNLSHIMITFNLQWTTAFIDNLLKGKVIYTQYYSCNICSVTAYIIMTQREIIP